MSIFDELGRSPQQPAWEMRIAGLGTRYYSGPEPAAASPYTYAEGIQSVEATTHSLEAQEGVGTSSGTVVRLRTRNPADAAKLLLRNVPEDAAYHARLIDTIDLTGAATVTVLDDISDWPATGQLWIGAECMNYTAKNDGNRTFTVPLAGRAYYGSRQQKHIAVPDEGWAPVVSSECISWRNRAVTLLLAMERRIHGSRSTGSIEEVKGYLAGPPQLEGDGMTVVLEVVPNSSKLDIEVGGDERVTHLQHGWHVFGDDTGKTVWRGERWKERQAFEQPITGVDGAGTNNLTFLNAAHQDIFDPTAGLPPRAGLLAVSNQNGSKYEPTAYPAANNTTVQPALANATAVTDTVWNVETQSTFFGELASAGAVAVRWPGEALDTLHDDWAPGTNQGASGAWIDVTVSPDGPDGPALICRLNSDEHRGACTLELSPPRADECWAVDLAPPSHERPVINIEGRMLGGWELRQVDVSARKSQPDEAPTVVPIRGVARAWYQTGEVYLHVENDVFKAAPFWVRVKFESREGQGYDSKQWLRITKIEAATDVVAGVPGYLLTVDEEQRAEVFPFGDWHWTGDRVAIEQAAFWRETDAVDVIRQLLFSEEGEAFTSATYDLLPSGAGLTTDEVDVDSFDRVPQPPILEDWREGLDERRSIADIVAPIHRLLGASLVDWLNPADGTRKLRLVSTGAAVASEIALTIGADDWIEEPAQEWDTDIENRLEYRANFDREEEEFLLRVPINDRDSIQEHGGSERVEEALRGVYLDEEDFEGQRAVLLPFALERFAIYGRPRLIFRGGVLPWHVAYSLSVGDAVNATVTNAYAAGEKGVTGAMRIIEMERRPDAGEVRVDLRYDGFSGAGYAPSLTVTAAPAADEVTVSANAHTEAAHPITGAAQSDVDFFSVGDVVVAIPLGDYANRTNGLTITAIVGNTLTLDAAHGLAGPDFGHLRPDDYDSASDAHQAFAYISDDKPALGAADEDAKKYV